MNEDVAALREHLADLEGRLAEHQKNLVDAIGPRHEYLYRNAFGMAQTVVVILGLLGSAALAFFIYNLATPALAPPIRLAAAFGTFFVIFWLVERSSKRKLSQQMKTDAAAFPSYPEWNKRAGGSIDNG